MAKIHKKSTTKHKKATIISPLNRQIAIGFVIVTIILALIIGYFSLARATIYITPKKQPISTTVEIEVLPSVSSTLKGSNILPGQIKVSEEEISDQFSASGEREKKVKARGMVTIINNYSRPQTLIATTRLLSPEGKLFRTTKTIVVPPGGKTKVEVVADKEGKEYELGPTRFIIPGLWEGLQDKIYGISEKPMSKTTIKENYVTAEDLEKAKQILLQRLAVKFTKQLEQPDKKVIIKTDIISSKPEKNAGEVASSFTFTITAKVTAITVNEKDLQEIAATNLKLDTPKNLEYLSFNPASINLELIRVNPEGNSATLKLYVEGLATVKLDNLYNIKDILGFAKQDVEKYFLSIKGVESVKVHFSPAWVKSVPPLEDHVEIKIIK